METKEKEERGEIKKVMSVAKKILEEYEPITPATPATPQEILKKNEKILEEANKILSYEHMQKQKAELISRLNDIKNKEDELHQKKMSLKKEFREQLNLGKRLLSNKDLPKEERLGVKSSMKELKRYSTRLINPGGIFTRLFLGSVNNAVLAGGLNRKYAFKQEYEGMKYRFTIFNFVITLLLIFIKFTVLDTFFRVILLYYYTAITLREEILRVNGSNIKFWWRIHHYTSIILCVVSISWPNTEIYWNFRKQFIFTNLYGCLLQFLQYKYQMRRLYILKSLGKAKELDTINPDPTSQGIFLKVLVPFIFIDICLVFWNTVRLLIICFREKTEWQAFLTAFLFLFLCVGNFYSLIAICSNKILFFRKIKERIFGIRQEILKNRILLQEQEKK